MSTSKQNTESSRGGRPQAARPRSSAPFIGERGRPESSHGAKLGSSVAAAITREVIDRGWPVGQVLGSEAELIERFEVSRSVFREAVRLLEHSGAATMRRGPGGGLIVTAPVNSAVASAAAIYLDYERVSPADLLEVRSTLELSAVELTTDRLDEEGMDRLRETVRLEEAALEDRSEEYVQDQLHLTIAELTGNPVFPLYVSVLTRLAAEGGHKHRYDAPSDDRAVLRAHSAIVAAIVAGDAGLARNRMRRHLEALAAWQSAPH